MKTVVLALVGIVIGIGCESTGGGSSADSPVRRNIQCPKCQKYEAYPDARESGSAVYFCFECGFRFQLQKATTQDALSLLRQREELRKERKELQRALGIGDKDNP